MTEEEQIRGRLEQLFSKPFTDYQWSLIAAQGYVDEISGGERGAEDVAQELRGLIEAASKRAVGEEEQDLVGRPEPGLTWDEMEKLVLGRILATGETSGPRSLFEPPSLGGMRIKRLAASRERVRRRWQIVFGTSLGVLAAGVVVALVIGGAQCGPDGGRTESFVVSSDTGALLGSSTTTIQTSTTVPEPATPEYTAELSGAEVVPSVESEAGGSLVLTFSEDGESVHFVLSLEDIDSLTIARLRVAQPGEEGDQIYTVYAGPTKDGLFTGVAADESFTADDLVGPLEGKTLADLKALLDEGSVYVIVGTEAHRSGELRGQLR